MKEFFAFYGYRLKELCIFADETNGIFMYKRELLTQLHQWSIREPRKPLVIRGARQVGKSTLVREFGKEFDIYVEVNLEISDDANIFLLNDDVTDIWRYLCLRNHIVSNQDNAYYFS